MIWQDDFTGGELHAVEKTVDGLRLIGHPAVMFAYAGGFIFPSTTHIPAPWTAEFHVRRFDSPKINAPLLDGGGAYTPLLTLEQWENTNRVGYVDRNGSTYVSGYSAPINSLIHLAFVADTSGTLQVYANGVLVWTVRVPVDALVCPRRQFGLRGDLRYDGLYAVVYETRVWGKALSVDDIQGNAWRHIHPDEPGLLHYWPMWEGAGSKIYDLVGENDGTQSGTITWVSDIKSFGHREVELDLSSVGIAASSSIVWVSQEPAGTAVTIETNLSLDGGETWQGWQVCTNGGPVPGITPGLDLSQARLKIWEHLHTKVEDAEPVLRSLTVTVEPQPGSFVWEYVEDTQADFQRGTLDNVVATPAGNLELAAVSGLEDLIVDGGEYTLTEGDHAFRQVKVLNGGTLYIDGLVRVQALSFEVDETSKIDGKGRGYPANTGPGKGGSGSARFGAGAGYGGRGGNARAYAGALYQGGPTYGSAEDDAIDKGSGGGSNYSLGGAGGAGLYIWADTISIHGECDLSGDNGLFDDLFGSGGGGGSGGGLLLKGSTVDLSGSAIYLRGGDGGGPAVSRDNPGGGGGGGRFKAFYETYVPPAVLDVSGGQGWSSGYASGTSWPGEQGTIYTESIQYTNPLLEGTRVSPILDLSGVGRAIYSRISWDALEPGEASVTIETNLSLDGGQTWQGWQVCTNGDAVPGIPVGADLSNARLMIRERLYTTSTLYLPVLRRLTIEIQYDTSEGDPIDVLAEVQLATFAQRVLLSHTQFDLPAELFPGAHTRYRFQVSSTPLKALRYPLRFSTKANYGISYKPYVTYEGDLIRLVPARLRERLRDVALSRLEQAVLRDHVSADVGRLGYGYRHKDKALYVEQVLNRLASPGSKLAQLPFTKAGRRRETFDTHELFSLESFGAQREDSLVGSSASTQNGKRLTELDGAASVGLADGERDELRHGGLHDVAGAERQSGGEAHPNEVVAVEGSFVREGTIVDEQGLATRITDLPAGIVGEQGVATRTTDLPAVTDELTDADRGFEHTARAGEFERVARVDERDGTLEELNSASRKDEWVAPQDRAAGRIELIGGARDAARNAREQEELVGSVRRYLRDALSVVLARGSSFVERLLSLLGIVKSAVRYTPEGAETAPGAATHPSLRYVEASISLGAGGADGERHVLPALPPEAANYWSGLERPLGMNPGFKTFPPDELWDDIWRYWRDGVDLLDLPEDYPYEDASLYNLGTGEVYEPLSDDSVPDVFIKMPAHHPWPQWRDWAPHEIEVDLGALVTIMLGVRTFWINFTPQINQSTAYEALTQALQYLGRAVERDGDEQLRRAFRHARWYAESCLLKRTKYLLKRRFDPWIGAPPFGVPYVNHGFQVLDDGRFRASSNASITFTLDVRVNGFVRVSASVPSGNARILIDGAVVAQLDGSQSGLLIPIQKGRRYLTLSAYPDGSTIEFSGLVVDGVHFMGAETVFVSDEPDGAEAMAEWLQMLMKYFELHHQDKAKGTRKVWN